MNQEHVELLVRGMDCAEEIEILRAALSDRPGIRSLGFDLLHRKLTVEIDTAVTSVSEVRATIAKTGMSAEAWTASFQDREPRQADRNLRTATTALALLALLAGAALHAVAGGWRTVLGGDDGQSVPWAVRISYLVSIVLSAWFIAPKAWFAVVRLRPDMNLLMCVAVVGAIAIGEWLEAATVALLFAVSVALEAWSLARARRAIAALMALTPTKARVVREGSREEDVEAENVAVGTTILVKPGEKFPIDGKISRGQTTVNQAPITGESVPVEKATGSEVFAGSVNGEGAVEVVTSKAFADSTISQIAKMVGEAHARRSPTEQWVEKFARIYTPVVIAFAILLALFPLVIERSWSQAAYDALVLLVLACPCALVISTPVTVVSALVAAAREGVIVKGGVHLESAATLNAIAFDKTGTLTKGQPSVVEVVAIGEHDQSEVLSIASAVDQRSTHPLARAIVAYATERGIRPPPAIEFRMVVGRGAHAIVDGVEHWLGSHRYLEERGQEQSEMHGRLEELAASGASVVVVGRADHVCGFIALRDELRPSAPEAITAMRAAGVGRIVLLSGDHRPTAAAVGQEVGVDEVRAPLLPEDKVAALDEILGKYGNVGMVGDGVNDAPALARSSLGMAMGVTGTDAALETSDVVFLNDDLSRVAWLIVHSRRTLRLIRQNVVAALAVKAAFTILAFLGYATLWGAILADTGMSLLVIVNALRLSGRTSDAA